MPSEPLTIFTCNVCDAQEPRPTGTHAYVCPWCGDGVMQQREERDAE